MKMWHILHSREHNFLYRSKRIGNNRQIKLVTILQELAESEPKACPKHQTHFGCRNFPHVNEASVSMSSFFQTYIAGRIREANTYNNNESGCEVRIMSNSLVFTVDNVCVGDERHP